MKTTINPKLYFFVFMLTIITFGAALFASDFLTTKKTEQIKDSEDKIAIDILSFETQFDILKESSCEAFDRTELRRELDSLSSRLSFMERQVGYEDPEVFRLKRYYSILEIKDYLLTKKMDAECGYDKIFILYFYSHKNCDDCLTQEYILRAVRDEYPQAEIYSFDYTLDLPAVQTLISLRNIPKNPPVIDINGKPYPGFDSFESMQLVLNAIASSTATTTNQKTR